jgi:hypothetical protein
MAETFDNILAAGTSAGSVLGTVPAGAKWVVIGHTISNTVGSLVTTSVTVGGVSMLKDVPIPAGSTLGALEGKLVLNVGETIEEVCSVDGAVDHVISYMEIT